MNQPTKDEFVTAYRVLRWLQMEYIERPAAAEIVGSNWWDAVQASRLIAGIAHELGLDSIGDDEAI